MELFLDVRIWLSVGVLMMLAELILPGGIVVFLGLAALLTAAALATGLVATGVSALTFYFIISLVLVLTLRNLAMKYVGGETSVGNTDEIVDAFGEVVRVVEEIGPADRAGRVRFRGTDWKALGDGSLLPVGSQARVVTIDNITLIVEPAEIFGREPTS